MIYYKYSYGEHITGYCKENFKDIFVLLWGKDNSKLKLIPLGIKKC